MNSQLSPTAESVARRYASTFTGKLPPGLDRDDLLPIAMTAAWEAEKRFDPRKGATLHTWLRGQVWHALEEHLRQEDHIGRLTRKKRHDDELPAHLRRAVSLEALVYATEGDLRVEDSISLPSAEFLDRDGYTPALREEEFLATIRRLLTSREYLVVLAHFWDEVPLTHLSKRCGWSDAWACNYTRSATRLLRERLAL